MSLFLKNDNNEILSFSDFVLSEAIIPKSVDYGLNYDMDDKSFSQIYRGYRFTFFEAKNNFYVVTINIKDGEVGFGASKNKSIDFDDYSDDMIKTQSALRIFNHVLYIVFEYVNKHKLQFIRFEGANPKLGKVYDRMVQNKPLLSYLETNGIIYKGLIDKKHVFINTKI